MPNSKSYRELHDRVARRPGAAERLAALRRDTLAEIGLPEPAGCERRQPRGLFRRIGSLVQKPFAAKRRCQCAGARLTVIVMSRAAAARWRVVRVALVPPASRRATAAWLVDMRVARSR